MITYVVANSLQSSCVIINLTSSIFLCSIYSIMEGEESLKKFSPEILVQGLSSENSASLLPHVILFHGTSDCSIPSDARFVRFSFRKILYLLECPFCAKFVLRVVVFKSDMVHVCKQY